MGAENPEKTLLRGGKARAVPHLPPHLQGLPHLASSSVVTILEFLTILNKGPVFSFCSGPPPMKSPLLLGGDVCMGEGHA